MMSFSFHNKKKEDNTSYENLTDEEQISFRRINRIDNLISFVVLICISLFLFLNFQAAIVPSSSMYPTLSVKEFVLVKKTNHKNLQRGDIVIFHHRTAQEKSIYCKRLIGIPGDKISIKNQVLYLNGQPQEESYCIEPMICVDMEEITLNSNEYFVMGDNRNNSVDSRVFGPVEAKDMIGYAILHHRFFPDPNLNEFYKKILGEKTHGFNRGMIAHNTLTQHTKNRNRNKCLV